MEDLISFDSKQGVFHLCNGEFSYLLSIEENNILSHLYFGKTIKQYHNQLCYPKLDRGFSGNLPDSNDRAFSRDTIPQEFSSSGSGDYRIPALIVQQESGSNAVSLFYKSHKIIKGKPKLVGLPAAFVEDDNEAETLIITLEDVVSRVEVDLLYTIYRDYSIMARSSCIRNVGDQTIRLQKASSIQIDFSAETFDVISLPGAHSNERHMSRERIGYGVKAFESRRGTSSHQMNPFIALVGEHTTEFSGDAFGFNFVYSGNHSFEIEKDQIDQLRLLVGINEYNFSWELKPQETFQTPEVLMTYSSKGLNAMSQAFHRIIRERVVRSKFKYQERPIVVNNWEATYFDFTEETLRPIVDEAKKLGIEMFVLDDGWFGRRDDDNSSLGDWSIHKEKFPKGLRHFSDYVHNQGLKFGLWLEPEMISIKSELYQQHPDYLMQVPNRKPSPSRNQFVLDLGRKEVRDNVFDQLDTIFRNNAIDYVKWDMNRHLSDVFSLNLNAENQGEASHRYVLGLYDLLERLTESYPDILFEGCSGGGGRFDTGFAFYMPQSWTSDNTDAVARMTIQYGTSLAYPISTMTAHVSAVPNHQTGRSTSLKTRGQVAMSGIFGYELDLTKISESEKEEIKGQVKSYKAIRQLVQFGNFYRLKNPSEGNEVAWMFVSNDKTEALLFTAQLLSYAQPIFTKTKLVGLEPNFEYEIKNLSIEKSTEKIGYFSDVYAVAPIQSNTVISGEELMNAGIYNSVSRRDFSTELYHLKVR